MGKIGVDIVKREVCRQVGPGIPNVGSIAAALGTSPRTLQRTLEASGLNFRAVLQQCQLDLAKGLLTSGNLTIDEIARRVGYRDASNFSRAFRTWTGSAPSDWEGAPFRARAHGSKARCGKRR